MIPIMDGFFSVQCQSFHFWVLLSYFLRWSYFILWLYDTGSEITEKVVQKLY